MEHRRVLEERVVGRPAQRVLVYKFFNEVDGDLKSFFEAGLSAMGWVKGQDVVSMKCRVCGAAVDRSTIGIVSETAEGGISKPKDNMYAMPVCPTDGCEAVGWTFFERA
jgi:hypothetical protein